MKNKHEGTSRGFRHLSRAWYGESSLKNADYVDAVTFGFYNSQGGTTGEMTVNWVYLGGEIIPKLTVYSDAWSALSQFHDLIDVLGIHDNEDSTPEQFCQFLLECGFVDMTETVQSQYTIQ